MDGATSSTNPGGESLRPSTLQSRVCDDAIRNVRIQYREHNVHNDSDEEDSIVALFCEEQLPTIMECVEDVKEFQLSDLFRGRKPYLSLPLSYDTIQSNVMFAKTGGCLTTEMFPSDSVFYAVFNWSKHHLRRFDHFQRALRHFPPDEMPWATWNLRNTKVDYRITIINTNYRCVKYNTKHTYCKQHTKLLRAPMFVGSVCTDCYFRYIINSHDNNIIQKMESAHVDKNQSDPHLWKYTTEVPIADSYSLNTMKILCKDIDDYWMTLDSLANSLFCNYCLKATFGELITGPGTRNYFNCIKKAHCV